VGAALRARGGSSRPVLDVATLHSTRGLAFPGWGPSPAGTASSTGCSQWGRGLGGRGGPRLPSLPLPKGGESLPARLPPLHRLPQPGPCEALEETKTEPN